MVELGGRFDGIGSVERIALGLMTTAKAHIELRGYIQSQSALEGHLIVEKFNQNKRLYLRNTDSLIAVELNPSTPRMNAIPVYYCLRAESRIIGRSGVKYLAACDDTDCILIA